MTELLIELQRSELLSLDKFLHLPVSLKGAFLVNYFGSLVNLTLALTVPAMAGLALGLVLGYGPAMLVLVTLVPTFLLMVTALTYQFQGWLASLMVNNRRRRTIIVVVTMSFILVAQLPNLLNIFRPWEGIEESGSSRFRKERRENERLHEKGEITKEELNERNAKLELERNEVQDAWEREVMEQVGQVALIANIVLPVGWLPLGAWAAAEGNIIPGVLGSLGMALIGALSLRRSYRTTVRLYKGEFTSGKGQVQSARAKSSSGPARRRAGHDPSSSTACIFHGTKVPHDIRTGDRSCIWHVLLPLAST